MDYNLKDLDCSRMKIHPNHPQLVNFLESNIPKFKEYINFTSDVFNKPKIYRYILLQYDPMSPIQARTSLDWFGKKYESAAYAGFPMSKQKNGAYKFSDEVLDMILGRKSDVVDMIVLFLGWLNKPKWMHAVYIEESICVYLTAALRGEQQEAKDAKEVRALFTELYKVSEEMAHEPEETEEFISRFYYQIEKSRLAIRPEDYAKALANGVDLSEDSPYGINYQVDRIKFLGDNEELL